MFARRGGGGRERGGGLEKRRGLIRFMLWLCVSVFVAILCENTPCFSQFYQLFPNKKHVYGFVYVSAICMEICLEMASKSVSYFVSISARKIIGLSSWYISTIRCFRLDVYMLYMIMIILCLMI